jgi:hypothetical protein
VFRFRPAYGDSILDRIPRRRIAREYLYEATAKPSKPKKITRPTALTVCLRRIAVSAAVSMTERSSQI